MKVLTGYAQTELMVKGSRFVTELFPCTEQSEARNIVKSQKSKYADSTHVVHAFVLGLSGEILGMSDDGEPGGTAGRPALDVLKGHGCTNAVMTITRWFGGTLLGTGGLVKAYGDCAKQVLAAADEKGIFEEYVEKKDFSFTVDYGVYQQVKRLLPVWKACDVTEDFGAEINIKGKVPVSVFDEMALTLKNLSNGKIIL